MKLETSQGLVDELTEEMLEGIPLLEELVEILAWNISPAPGLPPQSWPVVKAVLIGLKCELGDDRIDVISHCSGEIAVRYNFDPDFVQLRVESNFWNEDTVHYLITEQGVIVLGQNSRKLFDGELQEILEMFLGDAPEYGEDQARLELHRLIALHDLVLPEEKTNRQRPAQFDLFYPPGGS